MLVTERRYKFSVRTGSNNYDVKFAAAEEKGSYKHKTQSSDCDLYISTVRGLRES